MTDVEPRISEAIIDPRNGDVYQVADIEHEPLVDIFLALRARLDQLEARSKDHAEKLYADKLPDADFDQGVTLAAVPVRSWKPESYGASTKRVIGKRGS